MTMTRDEFAAMLNGREYNEEMTHAEEKKAAESRLLVVYGASDDLTEFAGIIYDEAGAYDGADHELYRNRQGIWQICPDDFHSDECNEDVPTIEIRAKWCPEGFAGSWLIETDLPHSTFDIMEDGELYCRGLVIDEADMLAALRLPTSRRPG